jgi:GT2 family glycosyltransferase
MTERAETQCDVSVLIVSFNTRAITLQCLEALSRAMASVSGEVIVVDNASSDGSAEAIRQQCPEVRVIVSETNLGFGGANNLAMRHARGRYWVLLNSDAFVGPDTLATLLRDMDARPEVGVLGPKLLNSDGSTQRSCFRYPSPGRAWLENLAVPKLLKPCHHLGDYRKWAHDESGPVDWVVGACLVVRRAVVDQVGGFDERFFMYAEETDWQKRIRDAGWGIRFTPKTRVTHLGGASGAAEAARVNHHFFESLDRYARKHHGRLGLVSLRLAMVTGALLRLPAWALMYIGRPPRRKVARAKIGHYGWLMRRQLSHWSESEQRIAG